MEGWIYPTEGTSAFVRLVAALKMHRHSHPGHKIGIRVKKKTKPPNIHEHDHHNLTNPDLFQREHVDEQHAAFSYCCELVFPEKKSNDLSTTRTVVTREFTGLRRHK